MTASEQENDKSVKRPKQTDLFLLIPVVIFSVMWSYILIVQLNSFNNGIFDYGVSYNLLWKEAFGVPAYPSSVGYLPYMNPTRLITFLLIPYMRLFPSLYNLLILDAVIMSLPAAVLYFLTLEISGSRKISFAVEMLWLLYYPNSAAIYYTFHYENLFPLFYIMGFYFFYTKRVKLSSLSFIISSITNLLAPLVLIFTIPTICLLRKRTGYSSSPIDTKKIIFLIASVSVASVVILMLNYKLGGLSLFLGQGITSTHTYPTSGSFYNALFAKVIKYTGIPGLEFILFMTFPLFFSIFVERKFLFAAFPSIAFYILAGSGTSHLRFFYPGQFSVWISPIVFVSFIFMLKKIIEHKPKENPSKRSTGYIYRNMKLKKPLIILVIFALICNGVLFATYSPVGPINQYLEYFPNANPPSDGGYGLYGNLSVSEYDLSLLNMASLIPDSGSVLSQFNMPQFSNRYYFTYPGQYDPSDPIDYAINDPANAFWFLTPVDDTGPDVYGYNMMQLSNMFLENSSYGIYGESMGAILFKLGYSGNIVYYVPLNENVVLKDLKASGISSSQMVVCPGTYVISLISPSSGTFTIYLGSIPLGKISTVSELIIKIPSYFYSFLQVQGLYGEAVLHLKQISPASKFSTSNNIPVTYHEFSGNGSHLEPLNVKNITINTESFSYIYDINLKTYEDGLTHTENGTGAGNNSEVFSLFGNYPYVWNQVDNNGMFMYGFRTQNATISSYIMPFVILTGEWVYVAAVFNQGQVFLFEDGYLIYSGEIFSDQNSVGSVSLLSIGGANPFSSHIPNLNPLNGSIANFVLLNGSLSLNYIENPEMIYENISMNQNVVFSDWINSP